MAKKFVVVQHLTGNKVRQVSCELPKTEAYNRLDELRELIASPNVKYSVRAVRK